MASASKHSSQLLPRPLPRAVHKYCLHKSIASVHCTHQKGERSWLTSPPKTERRFTTKTGAADNLWSSVTDGRSAPMPGKTRCCFWPRAASAVLHMIVVDTAALRSRGMG